MLLIFFLVNNSKDYTITNFSNLNAKESIDLLEMLEPEEWRAYDINAYKPNYLTLNDFVQDYNDEVLDGGWWCITVDDSQQAQ